MATGGFLVTPTSVATTGTGASATITTNGSVTFTAATGVILNGVFTSSYENYRIVFRCTADVSDSLFLRLRTGSSDVSGTNYAWQDFNVSANTINSARTTSTTIVQFGQTYSDGGAAIIEVFAPYLAAPTLFRSMTTMGPGTAVNYVYEVAGAHNVSTSYESISLYSTANAVMAGRVAVYGWNK